MASFARSLHFFPVAVFAGVLALSVPTSAQFELTVPKGVNTVAPAEAPPAGNPVPPPPQQAIEGSPGSYSEIYPEGAMSSPPPLEIPSNLVGPDGNPVPVQVPQQMAPGGTSTLPAPVETQNNMFVPQPSEPIRPVAPSEIVEAKPVEKTNKRTLAIFRTSVGNFTVRLFTKQVPRTSQHFIELVRGDKEFIDAKTGRKTRRPFYNGLIFHRVINNFIIQGGCPFGTGKGGPGFTIADEFTPNIRHKKAGILSMANAGQKDTNGSQFFITLGPQPEFDDKYTAFGEVTQGMDVVNEIARSKVGPTDRPIRRIYIIAIDIVEE